MQPLKISEIVKATGGVLIAGDENHEIKNITIDSRKAKGALFVLSRSPPQPNNVITFPSAYSDTVFIMFSSPSGVCA